MGSQKIIAISDFFDKNRRKKSGGTQNFCGEFPNFSKQNLGVVKIFLFFFDKFGKKSGGNENKGIPFILCSLIEKQRNSL